MVLSLGLDFSESMPVSAERQIRFSHYVRCKNMLFAALRLARTAATSASFEQPLGAEF
jgi:hypothetical protein